MSVLGLKKYLFTYKQSVLGHLSKCLSYIVEGMWVCSLLGACTPADATGGDLLRTTLPFGTEWSQDREGKIPQCHWLLDPTLFYA